MPPTRFLTGETLQRLARSLAERASKAKVRTVLIGGAALAWYGSPRMTADLDFAATGPISRGTPLAPGGKSFTVDDVTIDWIVRTDDYRQLYEDAIRAARDTKAGFLIARPEHLVAMKLAAGRAKDREDAIWLLQQSKGSDGWVDRKTATKLVRKFLGGTFAVSRFRKLVSIADWRTEHGDDADPGEEEEF